MTHLLVGNPTAQSGRNAARLERAIAWLAARGIACELTPTLPGGATVDVVRRALDAGTSERAAHPPIGVVIAMGGDGTFREVGAALLDSARREEIALGMLPTGTANDQGRSFGLDAGEDALERNLEVIVAGRETRLDAGRLTVTRADGTVRTKSAFFDSAGWGISARVLAARNEDRRAVEPLGPLKALYRDQLVYAGALLRVFLESYVVSDKFTARIVADGAPREVTGVTDLIVKGTRVYGGAWVFDRTSAHDDGMFEVVAFRGKRDWTSKAIVDLEGNPVTEEMLNAIGIEHTKPFRASHLEVRFDMPPGSAQLAGQYDGEELGMAPTDVVTIDVEKRAIRLIVP
jgi:diacylglycerol kinase family enzyme